MQAPIVLPNGGVVSESDLLELLKDPRWRIRNLYRIMDKDGNDIPFVPNEVQEEFLDELWYRNVVPKARQRGFSTLVQLMMLDGALFEPNFRGQVIAQDLATAHKIFRDKIMFAYDRLPDVIKALAPIQSKNKSELVLENNSSLMVGTSARGGTLQFLHVSEYGKICAVAPDKAAEIQSGALPAVAQGGIVVIESTVEGLDGNFTNMVKRAMALRAAATDLSKIDYKLHFASWWDAVEYEADPATVVMSPVDHAYFERMEAAIGRPISLRKRAWYVATRDVTFAGDKEKMWAQYPTTLEEAFSISTEGTWLGEQLTRARRENRITTVPYNPALPVNYFWDIGVADDVAIWCHQQDGPRNNFIDFIEGAGEPYAYFIGEIDKRGFLVHGRHYLPHDAAHRRPGAEVLKTAEDMLHDLGVKRTEIIPRIHELVVGITQMRTAFTSYWFDSERCKEGIAHLVEYRKGWNQRLQTWTSEPLKNGHQHAADALRQHGQMAADIRAVAEAGAEGSAVAQMRKLRKGRRGAMAS